MDRAGDGDEEDDAGRSRGKAMDERHGEQQSLSLNKGLYAMKGENLFSSPSSGVGRSSGGARGGGFNGDGSVNGSSDNDNGDDDDESRNSNNFQRPSTSHPSHALYTAPGSNTMRFLETSHSSPNRNRENSNTNNTNNNHSNNHQGQGMYPGNSEVDVDYSLEDTPVPLEDDPFEELLGSFEEHRLHSPRDGEEGEAVGTSQSRLNVDQYGPSQSQPQPQSRSTTLSVSNSNSNSNFARNQASNPSSSIGKGPEFLHGSRGNPDDLLEGDIDLDNFHAMAGFIWNSNFSGSFEDMAWGNGRNDYLAGGPDISSIFRKTSSSQLQSQNPHTKSQWSSHSLNDPVLNSSTIAAYPYVNTAQSQGQVHGHMDSASKQQPQQHNFLSQTSTESRWNKSNDSFWALAAVLEGDNGGSRRESEPPYGSHSGSGYNGWNENHPNFPTLSPDPSNQYLGQSSLHTSLDQRSAARVAAAVPPAVPEMSMESTDNQRKRRDYSSREVAGEFDAAMSTTPGRQKKSEAGSFRDTRLPENAERQPSRTRDGLIHQNPPPPNTTSATIASRSGSSSSHYPNNGSSTRRYNHHHPYISPSHETKLQQQQHQQQQQPNSQYSGQYSHQTDVSNSSTTANTSVLTAVDAAAAAADADAGAASGAKALTTELRGSSIGCAQPVSDTSQGAQTSHKITASFSSSTTAAKKSRAPADNKSAIASDSTASFRDEESSTITDSMESAGSHSQFSRPSRPRHWTREEDDLLRKAVDKFGTNDWKQVARLVPSRNHTQCLQRWTKVLMPGLKKGVWDPDEDQLLIERANAELQRKEEEGRGKIDWGKVSQGIEGRTAKQCRERWVNNLDPRIRKDDWSPEEDARVLKLLEEMGPKWAAIAKVLGDRTENMVKIRLKSLMRTRGSDSSTPSSKNSTRSKGKTSASTIKSSTKHAVDSSRSNNDNKNSKSSNSPASARPTRSKGSVSSDSASPNTKHPIQDWSRNSKSALQDHSLSNAPDSQQQVASHNPPGNAVVASESDSAFQQRDAMPYQVSNLHSSQNPGLSSSTSYQPHVDRIAELANEAAAFHLFERQASSSIAVALREKGKEQMGASSGGAPSDRGGRERDKERKNASQPSLPSSTYSSRSQTAPFFDLFGEDRNNPSITAGPTPFGSQASSRGLREVLAERQSSQLSSAERNPTNLNKQQQQQRQQQMQPPPKGEGFSSSSSAGEGMTQSSSKLKRDEQSADPVLDDQDFRDVCAGLRNSIGNVTSSNFDETAIGNITTDTYASRGSILPFTQQQDGSRDAAANDNPLSQLGGSANGLTYDHVFHPV